MHKNFALISIILCTILLTLACSISYEGVVFTDDEEISKELTATAFQEFFTVHEQAASTPEPTRPPLQSQEPVAVPESSAPSEYSVAATNFDCTCQVSGNVTTSMNIKGDQLEMGNPGADMQVYDKIGENTYKRSWMGYYILQSGEGDNKTETKVDEERHVVIIINNNGYIMEHYQGSSSSPCCFYTFTSIK